VDAANLRAVQMYELVEVGESGIVGEVIRTRADLATIQTYEDTVGLKPGDPVIRTHAPLCLTLGPGLIGSIYDGIQRPLRDIMQSSGIYIGRGQKVPSLSRDKEWPVRVRVQEAEEVQPGHVVAVIQETPLLEHRIMVPPHFPAGTVVDVKKDGAYRIGDPIMTLRPRDGTEEREIHLHHSWPVRQARPVISREDFSKPLLTGLRVIDTLFPVAMGGCAMIPGGFGTGKTMTQHSLAKWSDADVIVYVGCGERGNEMTQVLTDFPELQDPRTGRPLMERTVLVANTSNMPVAAREVSIYTGITLAEYFRDMGYDVAVMADSTSRWAEALRELSGHLGEMPAEEGFPPYLPARLAAFYERAGAVQCLSGRKGSVTIVGAVSPPGGDFAEPVTQHTRRFVRCFWALNQDLANARHYPAIHWLESYSEYVQDVTDWWSEVDRDWDLHRAEAIELLQREDRLQQIVKLVGPDVLPDSQRLVLLVGEMFRNGFLQQNAFSELDMYCAPEKQVVLLRIILDFYHLARASIDAGTPLAHIRSLQCVDEILRAASTIQAENMPGFVAIREHIFEALGPLTKELA